MVQGQEETHTVDLLQQWQNVYQEAISLVEEIENLPDECPCGDADAHLNHRCPCCGTHTQASHGRNHSQSCTELLVGLRADFALLCEDFTRTAGPMRAVALGTRWTALRRDVVFTADDLQKIAGALERVDHAVLGFRRSCAVSEMRSLKRACAELRVHCEALNRELAGG
jgi:hypothetical protein